MKAKVLGRSIPGFDLHEALIENKKYLTKCGGHEMAIGLAIKKDMLESFKIEFEKTLENMNIKEIIPVIKIDSQIKYKDINKKLIDEIKMLEPFGEKNKVPIFCYKNLKIDSIRSLTDGKHLKLTLKDDNYYINAIGFNLGYLSEEYLIGDKIDVIGTLEINQYNGKEVIQINIKDIMKSFETN